MEDFQNKLIENLQIELDDYYSEDNQNESTQ